MAMDDVIQSILDIDKKASDKLAEAEKKQAGRYQKGYYRKKSDDT